MPGDLKKWSESPLLVTNEYGDTIEHKRSVDKNYRTIQIYELRLAGVYHRTMAGITRAKAEINKVRGHKTEFK